MALLLLPDVADEVVVERGRRLHRRLPRQKRRDGDASFASLRRVAFVAAHFVDFVVLVFIAEVEKVRHHRRVDGDLATRRQMSTVFFDAFDVAVVVVVIAAVGQLGARMFRRRR